MGGSIYSTYCTVDCPKLGQGIQNARLLYGVEEPSYLARPLSGWGLSLVLALSVALILLSFAESLLALDAAATGTAVSLPIDVLAVIIAFGYYDI